MSKLGTEAASANDSMMDLEEEFLFTCRSDCICMDEGFVEAETLTLGSSQMLFSLISNPRGNDDKTLTVITASTTTLESP